MSGRNSLRDPAPGEVFINRDRDVGVTTPSAPEDVARFILSVAPCRSSNVLFVAHPLAVR